MVTNHYISSEGGDGDKTRIPTLHLHPLAGVMAPPKEAVSNSDKSAMLAGLMFPAHPPDSMVPVDFQYKDQLPDLPEITEEQVLQHLGSLSPYKAPGTDEIPNVVWKSNANLVTPYLIHIFRALLHLKIYPRQCRA